MPALKLYGPTKSQALNILIANDFKRLSKQCMEGFQVTPIITLYRHNIARSLSSSYASFYTLMLWAYLEKHIQGVYKRNGYTVSTQLIVAASTIAREIIRPFIPSRKEHTK